MGNGSPFGAGVGDLYLYASIYQSKMKIITLTVPQLSVESRIQLTVERKRKKYINIDSKDSDLIMTKYIIHFMDGMIELVIVAKM